MEGCIVLYTKKQCQDIVEILQKGGNKAEDLLEKGISVNTKNSENETALFLAAKQDNAKVVKFLLDHGANLDSQFSYCDWESTFRTKHTFLLQWAAEKGHENIVKFLVEEGTDINKNDAVDRSLLELAVIGGNEKIVKYLLDFGVDANAMNKYGGTAIHAAARQKNGKVIGLLLNKGVSVNPKQICESKRTLLGDPLLYKFMCFGTQGTGNGESPLHCAVKSGLESNVKLLLDKGANINAKSNSGKMALHDAVLNKNEGIVALLLGRGADIRAQCNEGKTVLHDAAASGNENVVNLLLEKGADILATSNNDETVLHLAAESGNEDIFKLLVDKGASVNGKTKTGKTLLHSAVQGRNENIVKLLLDLGLDADAKEDDGWTPLSYITVSASEQIILSLIQHGANVNAKIKNSSYENILHFACAEGFETTVTLLLEENSNLPGRDQWDESVLYSQHSDQKEDKKFNFFDIDFDDGWFQGPLFSNMGPREDKTKHRDTALNLAVGANSIKVTELLLDFGADINATTSKGSSPLNIASRIGNEELVKLLLERGADIFTKNLYGETALHGAVKYGRENIVKLLLNLGLNIDEKAGSQSYNALHYAVEKGNERMVELLLNLGADIASKSKYRDSALSLALRKGFDQVVKLLLDRGANSCQDPTVALSSTKSKEMLRTLLQIGTDVNAVDEKGNTALPIILHNYYSEAINEPSYSYGSYKNINSGQNFYQVELLLDHGANCNGKNVMKSALYDDRGNNLERLLDYQVNINLKEGEGYLKSPIHNALSSKKNLIAKKLIIRHIVKMQSGKLDVSQEYLNYINSNRDLSNFKVKCEVELEKMKSEVLEDSTVCTYDILATKDLSQLAAFARNEKILQQISSVECAINYPIYASALNNQLRRGKWRFLLLDAVKSFFSAVARAEGNEGLPKLLNVCVDKIYTYLRNKDLRMLIQVCNIPFDVEICDVTI